MIKTKNKKLKSYIELFHNLTFKLEMLYENVKVYNERLHHFENVFIPYVKKIRFNFKAELKTDKKLMQDMIKYMTDEQDYLFFCNAFMSAPDQRKFESSGLLIPFVAFFYQVVFWELSNSFSISVLKPRDMGVSFCQYAGHSMYLAFAISKECLFLSENESKVDSIGDLTQTAMGRIRYLIQNDESIFTLKNFTVNKYLNLYKNANCGIVGKAMTTTATNQMRSNKIILDEAGLIKKLKELKTEMQMTSSQIIYMGTLKPASDSGFREILKKSILINHIEIWNKFKNLIENTSYRNVWDLIANEIKKEVKQGETLKIKLSFKDHPLKAHISDYETIERNRLFNDEIAIAHQLLADENAGNPDRSFYNLQNDNFITEKEFEEIIKHSKGFEIHAGFDPGSANTVSLVPVLKDNNDNMFVFPAELFSGTYDSFLQKIIEKYCKKYNRKMIIHAESSVMSYSGLGSGWSTWFKNYPQYFDLHIVTNQHQETQLLVANHIFTLFEYNRIFQKQCKKILIHEDNKQAYMTFISGAKYSGDKEQKEISHKSEALLSIIYNTFKYLVANEKPIWGG